MKKSTNVSKVRIHVTATQHVSILSEALPVAAIQASVVTVLHVPISTSVLLELIVATRMQHVLTRKEASTVTVMMVSLEMGIHVRI